MEFQSVIQQLFFGLLSFCAVGIVMVLVRIYDTLQSLNEKMAVIITKTELNEQRIEKLELRLEQP